MRSVGVWINLKNGPNLSTASGRHRALGESLMLFAVRSLNTASADGSSSGLPASIVVGGHHTPDKSGLPSGIRGVAPDGGGGLFAAAMREARSSPTVFSVIPTSTRR